MKKLIIGLMLLLGLSASAQIFYVGQFAGLDYGNSGITNSAGQTIDQRATTAAGNVVTTSNSVQASDTQFLMQSGTVKSNDAISLALYYKSFANYVGVPLSVNLHATGRLNSESNQLYTLTNMVNANLTSFVPNGMVYLMIDEEWVGTGYTNWNTANFPNGFTNIIAYAHANGIKVIPNQEPGTINSAGTAGISTNYELYGQWVAQQGFDGFRIDHGSMSPTTPAQKRDELKRIYLGFMSAYTNNAQPLFETELIDSGNTPNNGTNAIDFSSLPPGFTYDFGYDPAALPGGDNLQFSNLVWAVNNLNYPVVFGGSKWVMLQTGIVNATSYANSPLQAWALYSLFGSPMELIYLPPDGANLTVLTNGLMKVLEDPAHEPPRIVYNTTTNECWVRNLANGDKYVVLENSTTNVSQTFGFKWSDVGLPATAVENVYDYLQMTNGINSAGSYSNTIPGMGVVALRLFPNNSLFLGITTNISWLSFTNSSFPVATNWTEQISNGTITNVTHSP